MLLGRRFVKCPPFGPSLCKVLYAGSLSFGSGCPCFDFFGAPPPALAAEGPCRTVVRDTLVTVAVVDPCPPLLDDGRGCDIRDIVLILTLATAFPVQTTNANRQQTAGSETTVQN